MKRVLVSLLMVAGAVGLEAQVKPAKISPASASKIEKELEALHDQLRDAVRARDRAALNRIYADEFLLIHTTGGRENKAETIAKSLTVDTSRAATAAPAQDSVQLNVYGNVAVRTARAVVTTDHALWWTWVYVKRAGRWQIVRQHGTAIPASKEVKIDPAVYDALVGTYEYRPGAQLTVSRRGNDLIAQGTGRPEFVLLPESATRFHVPGGGATYTFFTGDDGKVSYVILQRADGMQIRGNRIR